MGAWGPAIFSNDTASDLREDYLDKIAKGVESPAATDRLMTDYAPDGDDGYYAAEFWIALALTQQKCGRLEDRVKNRALGAIGDGSAVGEWSGKDRAKRLAALEKARADIEAPPIAPKKIRRPVPCSCGWKKNDLVSYRMLEGDLIVFLVTHIGGDKGGVYPTVQPLDWRGAALPPPDALMNAPIRLITRHWFNKFRRDIDPADPIPADASQICIVGLKEQRNGSRFQPLGISRDLPSEPVRPTLGVRVLGLKDLDAALLETFDFR
jgi:hypothetical protein